MAAALCPHQLLLTLGLCLEIQSEEHKGTASCTPGLLSCHCFTDPSLAHKAKHYPGHFGCVHQQTAVVQRQGSKIFLSSQSLPLRPAGSSLLAAAGTTQPEAREAISLSSPTYQEAMMELRESSTSEAVRRCCGSRTSSFRIKHTVFSETRPSLWERTGARGSSRMLSHERSHHCSDQETSE